MTRGAHAERHQTSKHNGEARSDYVSVKEAARRANCDEDTIFQEMADGAVHFNLMNGKTMVSLPDVLKLHGESQPAPEPQAAPEQDAPAEREGAPGSVKLSLNKVPDDMRFRMGGTRAVGMERLDSPKGVQAVRKKKPVHVQRQERETIQSLRRQVAELEGELVDERKRHAETANDLQSTRQRLERTEAERRSLADRSAVTVSRPEPSQASNDDRVRELEDDIEILEARCERLADEVDRLERMLARETERTDAQRTAFEQAIARLNQRLAAARKERDAMIWATASFEGDPAARIWRP